MGGGEGKRAPIFSSNGRCNNIRTCNYIMGCYAIMSFLYDGTCNYTGTCNCVKIHSQQGETEKVPFPAVMLSSRLAMSAGESHDSYFLQQHTTDHVIIQPIRTRQVTTWNAKAPFTMSSEQTWDTFPFHHAIFGTS